METPWPLCQTGWRCLSWCMSTIGILRLVVMSNFNQMKLASDFVRPDSTELLGIPSGYSLVSLCFTFIAQFSHQKTWRSYWDNSMMSLFLLFLAMCIIIVWLQCSCPLCPLYPHLPLLLLCWLPIPTGDCQCGDVVFGLDIWFLMVWKTWFDHFWL